MKLKAIYCVGFEGEDDSDFFDLPSVALDFFLAMEEPALKIYKMAFKTPLTFRRKPEIKVTWTEITVDELREDVNKHE